jgi:homoserine O-acetyltransferase/O-succinyltransferase
VVGFLFLLSGAGQDAMFVCLGMTGEGIITPMSQSNSNGWTPSAALRYCRVATPSDPFITENGAQLSEVTVAYETWGQLSPTRDNVVLVFHALTGDSHAARHPDVPGDRAGWWEPVVGPGKPIDTDQFFVICANTIGSCYGTTGPRSIAPDGERYNLRFPALTVRDLVRCQLRLLDALGISTLVCAIGGSLGGMQVVELAVTAPQKVEQAVVIAASARFHSQGIAFNEVQRRAIMLDPRWRGGDYDDDCPPEDGIGIARMLGMITFQSDQYMTERFDRLSATRPSAWEDFQGRYDVEGYLHHQGRKLATRFDANTYLYLSRAMDTQDIGRGRGSLESAAARISARTTVIGVSSDLLFPPAYVRQTAEVIQRARASTRYVELDSPEGHDAFLKEFERLDPVIRSAVSCGPPSFETAMAGRATA